LAYEAALTKIFLREFRKLPQNVRDRILKAIDEIIASPFSGVRLRDELEGRWRWRVGKHRIIYRIDQATRLVVFLDVGLRKSVYD